MIVWDGAYTMRTWFVLLVMVVGLPTATPTQLQVSATPLLVAVQQCTRVPVLEL